MSDFQLFVISLYSFLVTYVIHSTVIISGIALVVSRTRWFRRPLLRVLAWKLSIVLPLLTTIGVTFLSFPHLGIEIALSETKSVSASPDVAFSESDRLLTEKSTTEPALSSASQNEFYSDSGFTLIDQDDFVRSSKVSPSFDSRRSLPYLIVALWVTASFVGLTRLVVQTHRLHRLRRGATPVSALHLLSRFDRLTQIMSLRTRVELLKSEQTNGAFTAGIFRPFIVLSRPLTGASRKQDEVQELDALFAHELAHIVHRDAAWNLFVQIIQRIFLFQPLNRFAIRRLQVAMDFAADELATKVLGGQEGLVQCLIRLGDQLFDPKTFSWTRSGLVVGMVAFRSALGQRVELLLESDHVANETSKMTRLKALTALTAASMTIASLVPQAVAEKRIDVSEHQSSSSQVPNMKTYISTLAVLIGLSTPVDADGPQNVPASTEQQKALKATPDELAEGIQRFNGMLVGRLAAKDVEKGSFVVVVDAVPRVWRNSRAENPKSIVGKSVQVTGVFGRFLDVLVTTRIGETIEFECKHDSDALVFPGELLRKVAPYKTEDYPELPEEFRGFRGVLNAEILKKDPETFELIVKVQKVAETWEQNKAKQSGSIVGKSMMLAGFWNRKEVYHNLKVGDRIEVGVQHIEQRSDHLTVAEFVRKAKSGEEQMMSAVRGFRGMIVGRLVAKDVERGTFTVTVDAVPRVWRNNESRSPKSLIGQNVDAEGVPQQLLDALVVTRIGETIQFGALHDGEDSLRVGEVLRKVAPVKKGDYPELPDDFRGFTGELVGKVIKKDQQLWELTVEVTDVGKSYEKDQSRNSESVVGKQVMLSGFWNKKDNYHSLSVGDKIRVRVEHPQKLGDQLSVIEGVRKLDQ